jgi:tRNA-uridine 2-sulfurtransferase
MSRNGKVLVAMSGGVDSSVAACLLKERGYECVGVFMRVGAAGTLNPSIPQTPNPSPRQAETPGATDFPRQAQRPDATGGRDADAALNPSIPQSLNPSSHKHGCCSVADALDARAVATRLGIPFHALNFEADFAPIVDYFVDEYARGRTPNPCILCNTRLKFGKLLAWADLLEADFVATGHYARIVQRGSAPCLARAANHAKDQSYVLFGLRRDDLRRCRFPLGEIADKSEVRRLAATLGLAVHDKPDSQEICFVPDQDYKRLVRARRPETQRPGEIVDADGRVLARHEGVANFTIGQRRGLGFAAGKPVYVTRLDVVANRVAVGSTDDLLCGGLFAERVNWLVTPPAPEVWQPAAIKIRHMHTPAAGAFRVLGDAASSGGEGPRVEVRFDTPQTAVTPGQAAVFYDADEVALGGGWIAEAMR